MADLPALIRELVDLLAAMRGTAAVALGDRAGDKVDIILRDLESV